MILWYCKNSTQRSVISSVDKNKRAFSLKEALLDEDNRELLLLTDQNGAEAHYKQVATLKRQGEIFCILKPLGSACKRAEAVLFKYTDENELVIQRDKPLLKELFNAYRASLTRRRQIRTKA